MAGKIQIFAGNSHPEFADKVAEHLGLKVSGPDVRDRKGKQVTMFSNGNLFVDIKRNVRDDNCFVIQTQAPNVSDHCMELFFLVRALKAAKARSVTAVMPYMPYIRSDKKDHARACIGARLFLDLLKESGVDRIIIMDPHFEQVHGFIDEKNVEVEIFRSKPVLAHHIRNSYDLSNAVVVMADIGGAKRSSSMVNLRYRQASWVMCGARIASCSRTRPPRARHSWSRPSIW
jgi:ribose-phosphate pyrophosphokinase